MANRVAITGRGTVNPLGHSVEETWGRLIRGESGIGPITLFDPKRYGVEVHIAGEVKGFDPRDWGITKREVNRYDRVTQLAIAASRQAISEAGIMSLSKTERENVGVIVGTGIGGLGSTLKSQNDLMEKGAALVSVFTIPRLMANAPANVISMQGGFRGRSYPISTACAAGPDAIGHGYERIRWGNADIMVVGGTEACILPLAVAAFTNMHALSRRPVADPTLASCPFDRARDGFVLAEGATILVLESEAHAWERNATIFGYVAGYGQTTDAYDLVKPREDGSEAARAIDQALAQAWVRPDEIAYVNAHGTSTPLNDTTETEAIWRVFNDYTPIVPVSSTKSMTGHQLGAGGAFEAWVCVEALRRNMAPPTINLCDPDPACDLNHIKEALTLPPKSRYALSNSFGFGGVNAVLVFETAA